MPTKAPKPVPEGMSTLTSHLYFKGNCKEAFEFYQKAFDAKKPWGDPYMSPDGKTVMHAVLKFGDTVVMMADEWPGQYEQAPKEYVTIGLWMYVEDADTTFDIAVNAGCQILQPVTDMFWGDRLGKLKDPYGYVWDIATHKWIFTEDEMAEGEKKWIEQMAQQ